MNIHWLIDPKFVSNFNLEDFKYSYTILDENKDNIDINNIDKDSILMYYGTFYMGKYIKYVNKYFKTKRTIFGLNKHIKLISSLYGNLIYPLYYCDSYRFLKYMYLAKERGIDEYFLNHKYSFISFKQLKENPSIIFHNKEQEYFIKSDSGKKIITGDCYDYMTFPAVINDIINKSKYVSDNEYIVYSEKKNIIKEFRCFIINGNINYLSTSSYIVNNEQNETKVLTDEKAINILRLIANNISPEIPLLTVDLCQLDNGEWKIVELNNPLFSGMYMQNSISKILTEISIFVDQNVRNMI